MFKIGAAAAVVASAVLVIAAAGPNDPEAKFIGARGNYWAFQKVERPAAPAISDPWIRTPIDAFILEGLQAKKLQPSAPLDRIKTDPASYVRPDRIAANSG